MYNDFLLSAAAIAPILEAAKGRSVGAIVRDGVHATRRVVETNTNLGILLLLAPLACVPREIMLRDGVERVLDRLTIDDAHDVYEAIRLAKPGGLGHVQEQDVQAKPTQSLRAVMALAADRDLIARQYVNGYDEVFHFGLTALSAGLERTNCLEGAIVFAHLSLMAAHADSLIARKRGPGEAEESARRAAHVLEDGWPHTSESARAFDALDAWLRAQGHARNPGTTADLVTACLFVALREGSITVPSRYPWKSGLDNV
jgi:triphosphoribosyl-dephospho-CoA synthase